MSLDAVTAGLAQLELISCSSLEALPPTLGKMSGLTRLDCQGCGALASLPDSLSQLARLQILNLTDCRQLGALPAGITVMTQLQTLCLEGCSALRRPPESAAWTADMYCRQLDARFAPPPAGDAAAGSRAESSGKAPTDPASLLQPSDLTLMCLNIVR